MTDKEKADAYLTAFPALMAALPLCILVLKQGFGD
jgi:hypothetical protein